MDRKLGAVCSVLTVYPFKGSTCLAVEVWKPSHTDWHKWYARDARHSARLQPLCFSSVTVPEKGIPVPQSWWRPVCWWVRRTDILGLEIRGFGILGKEMMWPFSACKNRCQMSFPLKQKPCSSLDNYHWAVPSPQILLSKEAPWGVQIYIYNRLPSETASFQKPASCL